MRTLLFTGLGLFVLSLFLPAMPGGDVVLSPTIPGWTVAVFSMVMLRDMSKDVVTSTYVFSLGFGNFVLLASPYLLFRLYRKSSPWIPLVMFVTTLNSLAYVFVAGPESVLIGYYVWVLAHGTIAASLIITFFQVRRHRVGIRSSQISSDP